MDPKSVVMIAYFFPPEGNAAVYRPLRFLKGLVKEGWHVAVISCEPYRYERYDQALLEQVPLNVQVVRVKGRDPWRAVQSKRGTQTKIKLSNLSTEEARRAVAVHHSPWRSRLREWVRIAETWVYRPDMAMPWIRPAVQASIEVCQSNRPSVIWATIGPLSAGLVAYRTSVATGIPYVLDFRDPWGLEYYPHEIRRPAWAKEIDNRNMCRLFKKAQAVVFMFESVAQAYLRAFPGALERTKIHIIPNGFEGEVESFVHAPGNRCTVLYAGTLSTYRHDTLLEGLAELKRQDPALAARLRMLFVGEGLQQLAERVADLDLRDMFEIRPPVPSAEVRRLQREAHALLVLGRMPGRAAHDLVAGAKLFGYLQAGRPIIGIVPRDETRRILGQVGSSLTADADSPSEVVTVMKKILEAWSSTTLEQFIPNRASCEAYSSNRQISDLITAVNGASAEKVPTAEVPAMPINLRSEVTR
ncbi:MAG: hypothetical protein OEU68_05455 [Nitrospira sp.]|nr:hypothetical protein [Nitrospira sp.]MDH4244019.1 hypothetical protein [Nitrospira sp.]MDH4355891.1 hypothetical protein [Nitrospira sp.]MDH5317894.1 hypothetical protein [Nitrospira sp.]